MKGNRRQFLQTTAAVGIGAGVGLIGAPALAQSRTKVKVGYLHTLAVDGQIWLAMDRGSFAKHGLDPQEAGDGEEHEQKDREPREHARFYGAGVNGW